ncbi:hypothetical protein RB595_002251 [Gaeumannomyces hyphopodioides]
MHDNRSHPLLEQVPLTVSPFVTLPKAPTLPYTYRAMPSALPSSATGIGVSASTVSDMDVDGGDDGGPSAAATSSSAAAPPEKPRYVVSATGHAAHPDDIVASCRALQVHVARLQADAEAELRALDERIRARELAEKRRVAPGWLDSDARILEPERRLADGMESLTLTGQLGVGGAGGQGMLHQEGGPSEMAAPDYDPGTEIDRAFAGR